MWLITIGGLLVLFFIMTLEMKLLQKKRYNDEL